MNAQVQSQAEVTTVSAEEKAEAEQKEQLHGEIKANFNNKVDIKETKFHFRKIKDEASGVETKRPTVNIPIPTPSVEGLISIIEAGGKGLELLLDAAYEVVVDQAREFINANESADEANFPYANLSWEYIANLPKAERRGGGISKEVWEEFVKDYIAIMPGVTSKPKESCELAAKVFFTKFRDVKTDKKVLSLLKNYLALYINSTPNAEQFADCVEFLDKKATALLQTDSSALLDAL